MAGLVDQWGKPIDFGRLKERKAGADLMGVRSPISGRAADGLDPVRLAGILRGAESGDPTRYLELAEQMEERYLHYLSVLGTRKRAVAQLDITIEAASADKEDEKIADFVREWVDRDDLELEVFDMLDAVGKGFSVTEIVWDVSGNTWLPKHLCWVDPRWIEFDQADLRTPLLKTIDGPQALAPYGFIVHEHKAKSGLAIRGGLARAASWSYLFQSFAIKDWVAFAGSTACR
jgi:phage gp29-like protein